MLTIQVRAMLLLIGKMLLDSLMKQTTEWCFSSLWEEYNLRGCSHWERNSEPKRTDTNRNSVFALVRCGSDVMFLLFASLCFAFRLYCALNLRWLLIRTGKLSNCGILLARWITVPKTAAGNMGEMISFSTPLNLI